MGLFDLNSSAPTATQTLGLTTRKVYLGLLFDHSAGHKLSDAGPHHRTTPSPARVPVVTEVFWLLAEAPVYGTHRGSAGRYYTHKPPPNVQLPPELIIDRD